jgi:hypothetical protein
MNPLPLIKLKKIVASLNGNEQLSWEKWSGCTFWIA